MKRGWVWVAAAAKSLQPCPTLCNPIDSSPPGSPVPGILQARTLEWVAISFSSAWKWKVKVKSLSRVRLFATPWTVAYQAPPSMGFSKQEHWSRVPLPSPNCQGDVSLNFSSVVSHCYIFISSQFFPLKLQLLLGWHSFLHPDKPHKVPIGLQCGASRSNG